MSSLINGHLCVFIKHFDLLYGFLDGVNKKFYMLKCIVCTKYARYINDLTLARWRGRCLSDEGRIQIVNWVFWVIVGMFTY